MEEKNIRRLKDLYHNPELYIKYYKLLCDMYGEEIILKNKKLKMKKEKQHSMDFNEETLRFVINEQMKDMNDKELRLLYDLLINIKKKKK